MNCHSLLGEADRDLLACEALRFPVCLPQESDMNSLAEHLAITLVEQLFLNTSFSSSFPIFYLVWGHAGRETISQF